MKQNWLYMMVDRKRVGALIKVGISSDSFKNRIHAYKTSNPCLELVATADLRTGYEIKEVEQMFFQVIKQNCNASHKCGEWLYVEDEKIIDAIEEKGFRYFDNRTKARIKNITMYNKEVCELWESKKR